VPAFWRVTNDAGEETTMPTFIVTLNWTDQGIRNVKDAPKRATAARELGKKLGIEMKHLFLTTGDADMLAIVEAADENNLAKFAMMIGGQGNVRTKTVRAWPEAEFVKLVSELP
jgi:uncharacterized protein with GYD domain